MTLSFTVMGTPIPQGSKTALISKSTGRAIVIDKDARLGRWRSMVTAVATTARGLNDPLAGPVGVRLSFYLARPQGHFGTGKNVERLKPSAPARPWRMPDIDKLTRGVLDALTDARVWNDDGQVVSLVAHKTYVEPGQPPGVHITVGEVA